MFDFSRNTQQPFTKNYNLILTQTRHYMAYRQTNYRYHGNCQICNGLKSYGTDDGCKTN